MPELSRFPTTPRSSDATVRVVALAERQGGVVGRWQLEQCGLVPGAITRWLETGRLHRIHPRVYAVGHRSITGRGQLIAALLYALPHPASLEPAPLVALSHLSAASWWGLTEDRGSPVEISARGRAGSIPGVRVHHPRRLDAVRHDGLPVTTIARTLLDVAPHLPFSRLRRMVAEADYQRRLNLAALGAQLGRGRHGSAVLRRALALHTPRLARTLSALEERFLAMCEDHQVPLPEVNVTVAGLLVDALWRRERVVVELDGARAHATAAAMQRDRDRDLALRAAGYEVRRYTWQQVIEQPEAVVADLRRALAII